MPVLTARQARDTAPEPERVRYDLPERAKQEAPVDKIKIRMHHPDDPAHGMNLDMDLGGAVIEIRGGVAIVGQEAAKELERRGWLRGSEVEVHE